MMKLWSAAVVAGAVAWSVKLALPPLYPLLRGMVVLPVFGIVYLAAAFLMRVPMPAFRR
jgi:hypothetical protein